MTTVHAYTADRACSTARTRTCGAPAPRPSTSCPTSTGAARAVGLVIPELGGRLNGIAVRVPTPTGSLVDLTIEAERATSARRSTRPSASARHGAHDRHPGLQRGPIVSSDIVKSPYSSIYDAPLTSVMNETQVKVVSWYDNEWGYATRLVELAALVLEPSHVPLSAQGAAVV
jgi:glyceraldehyde 3-phosphate dehydrogenase